MTVGEVVRQIESYNRTYIARQKEKATYDYIHASLIVKGVSITLGAKDSYPQIQEVYSSLFNDDTYTNVIEEKRNELTVLRFKQFAQSYNKAYKNKEVQPKE